MYPIKSAYVELKMEEWKALPAARDEERVVRPHDEAAQVEIESKS